MMLGLYGKFPLKLLDKNFLLQVNQDQLIVGTSERRSQRYNYVFRFVCKQAGQYKLNQI